MKININNEIKVKAAINAVQGPRISARTIHYSDVESAINEIEKRLTSVMLKQDWQGVRFAIDANAQSFPGSYKGSPDSTQFHVERGASTWFITSMGRGGTFGPEGRVRPLNLKSKTSQIMNHLTADKNWK